MTRHYTKTFFTYIPQNVVFQSKFESYRRYHIQNTILPTQHHDKNTVNVKVYQNTKIAAQRLTTDTN